MRILFGCAFVAVAACFSMLPSSSFAEIPKVGDSAPDFEMQGSDGKTYKAKDFVGKRAVIIAWFPRAFTGGCTKVC